MPFTNLQQVFEAALEHHRNGRLAEAETAYRAILVLQPSHVGALQYLGVAAFQTGRNETALELIGRAIALNPMNAAAYVCLGEAYRALGRLAEAIGSYHRAIEIEPTLPEAHNNLGVALMTQGRTEDAVKHYQRALELRPQMSEIHKNLGLAYVEQHFPEKGIAAHTRALELNPNYAEAQNNLGVALFACGRIDEAIAAYRKAERLAPDRAEFQSNIIFSMYFAANQISGAMDKERKQWNIRFGLPLARGRHEWTNEPDPQRILRIGYVSTALCNHVVGQNLRPLFRFRNRQRYEISCYSGALKEDSLGEEFREAPDRWNDVTRLSDEAVVEMIRGDSVDILVDLSQHSVGNRLRVFADTPAPVQVSFAGYPESTGVEAIGYRISDRWLEGKEECGMTNDECGKAERVYLIDSFWCYDPCGMDVPVNELPAPKNGSITFGSLNSFGKINDLVLQVWARVLAQIKNSRLVLLSGFGSHRQRTVDFLAQRGVEPRCVEFLAPCPRKDYLELYHRVDIALDPFPYGGHTTSLDALWMGVPVVSLAGEGPISRAALSILNNLGLPELVTFSEDEYVNTTASLANDLPRLAELRRTLRSRMENSVLMDGPHFARQIEAAYRAMWREWCAARA